MTRLAIIVTVAAGLLALPAGAQDQSNTTLTDQTPQENASAGQVRGRAPGTWVRAAIARHSGLMGQRLTGPRFGQPNTEEAELRFGDSGSTSSSSGFGGLADLLSLATQFTSGNSAGGLADLIGGLAGAGGSTGSTTESTSGSTSGGEIPPPANGTEYTLEDLIALGEQYGGTQKTINTSSKLIAGESVSKGSAYQERNGRVFGGAIARLPKAEDRFQSNGTVQETPFRVRWANAMLQSFFSALTLGFQSQQFIDAIKDALRPIMLPPAESSSDTGGSSSSDGSGSNGSGSDGSSSDGGDSGTGGIEDITSDGGSGGDDSSTI